MDHFHTRTHKLKGNISPDIQENIKYTTQIMQDCNDLVQKQFKIGIDHEISIYIVYMDGLVNTEMLQESVIRPLLQDSFPQERTAISQYVIESADWKWIDTMEDAMTAVLSGNTILFLGGEARAILFSSKLFPTRGVQNADQEVAIVGPKDSFTESLRMNTALIQRHLLQLLLVHDLHPWHQLPLSLISPYDLLLLFLKIGNATRLNLLKKPKRMAFLFIYHYSACAETISFLL